MPLYIIPAILRADSDELNTYFKSVQTFNEQVCSFNVEAVDEALDAAGRVGSFVPLFAHDPESVYVYYPTVPNDINTLLEIYECVRQHLL